MRHSIIDPDAHFIVDADTRSITNETGMKLTVMQYDHNSERVTFEIPRYIENHDMLQCDLVMVLFTNTSRGTSVSARSTSSGVYSMVDLAEKEDSTDTLTCSWLIAREATQYVGTLKFQLQFVCHEDAEAGIPEYYWHTDQCDMIEIKLSLNSGNEIVHAYPDAFTSMDARVTILEKSDEGNGSKLSVRVDGIELRVEDNEKNIGLLEVESNRIFQKVSDAEGNVAALQQTATGLLSRVNNAEGDLSVLQQTAESITSQIADTNGHISSLQQTANGLSSRVSNAEGDISTLTQTTSGLSSRVADAERNVSTLEQTTTSLSSRVADSEGNISTLRQSVEEIKAGVGGSDGNSSELAIRVDEITTRVENNEGELSTLRQTADSLTSRISSTESDISELEGDVVENAAKYSQIKQTVDNISLEVSEPIDGGTNRYVTITLTVGGNTTRGVVMIDGNVDVSGQLSAEALYATLGDIARLKVDSLSTSRRIPMYLAGDESDDNYIDIEEQHIALRRAWTDGTTEQARDDFGALLYWEQDIEDADIGSDGYPYVDGARVFITTEETNWPVMVYSYDSGDRLRIMFDEDNNYGPRMVWGEGDGSASGNGRGYIEKLGLSFDIYNKGTDGVKRGIFIGDQYTDIVGQRRPTKIAFSGDVCNITLEGGITEKWTFNRTNGVITSVTDSNGHTCTLEGLE